MESMDSFERKALTFYGMICNAYRSEEEMEPPLEQLTLKNGKSLTEDLTAMLVAMKFFCDQVCPKLTEQEDLVGFSYILNRLAIQNCFDISGDEPEEDS